MSRAHAVRLGFLMMVLGAGACLDPTSVLNATMGIWTGANQTAPVDSPLPDSLAVQVVHNSGLPLEDITVTWEVETGGGTISPTSSLTDKDGIAKAAFTLGPTVGIQTVIARVEKLGFVRFGHTATAAP